MKWTRNEWAEIIGSIGLAALIGGYVRYSLQGELLLASKVILIGGAVLIVAAVMVGFGGIVKFFSRRSSQLGTNTTILTIAVIVILGLVNFVGFRHHKRFDLTTGKLFTLSDQTKEAVKGLKSDVNIAHFDEMASPQLDDLMSEYRNLSDHVKFQNVDPREKPDIAKDFGATHMGDVIVASGSRKQPLEPGPDGSFSEQDVTSAILKVTRNKVKTVCFVTGHSEKSLTDEGAEGYSNVDQGLKREGYDTKPVNLVTEGSVPPTCDVTVIAGPKQPLFVQEAVMVGKYMDDGGKALIEVDPQTDPQLDNIFHAWNINLGSNIVVDASGAGRLFGTGPETPLVVDYGESPITKKLQGGMTFFQLARTVTIADKSKSDPAAVELLKTSARSFTIPKLAREVRFDPKTAGPLSLGVAANRMEGNKTARLVVIGNSSFAENQWIGLQHNGDLFFNAVDWLAQDENLISIRPKSATSRHIILTEAQAASLRWIEMFFLPGIVILMGISIWWKRR